MNLYNFYKNPDSLKWYKEADTEIPEVFWGKYRHMNDQLIKRKNAMIKNPNHAFWYAEDVIRGPFPEGEKVIATHAEYSFRYARVILNAPFPEGEDAIAGDAQWSYYYAEEVLKGPFPKGEDAIATNPKYAYWYARHILDDKPFPKGEKAILNSDYAENYNIILGRE